MRLRRLLLGVAAGGVLACGTVRAAPGEALQLIDELIRQGDETPDKAIAAIRTLAGREAGASPPLRRAALAGTGIVQARDGRTAEALAQVAALSALGRSEPLAEADARLVRAEVELHGGRMEASYQQARNALTIYDEACARGPSHDAGCNYRDWWHALEIAERGAFNQGNSVIAGGYAQTMLDVARRNGDRAREAISLGTVALQAEANADSGTANRLMAQAQHLARADGAAWVQLSVTRLVGLLHFRRQQPDAVQRDYEAALAIAKAAGLKRPAMLLRANLADAYIHQGRPGDALAVIEPALPEARKVHDLGVERLLLHNATLAKLALGRVAEAKAEMTRVLELWQKDTGPGQQRQALREFGDALGKAGDAAGAIELFHREEALTTQIRAANKAAAEAELRARYDQDSQKRRIELLGRDNLLRQAQLDNQALSRRLWMFGGAALVLLAVLALMMYRRMRDLNRTLMQHEALLRAHSERDALTGLANRRLFREVMRARGGERAFRGALLMVDVDHFKRVNDHHGHAAGDRVLVEVTRRLGAAVRADDLVARWGGEEFLVFAPDVDGAELDQLAERLRVAVNQAPVLLDNGTALPTTVSIGYAAFPLPASHLPVSWEQAVNLADLSLYTAKNHGRDCVVGIVRTTAGSPQALRDIESDITQARHDGRVTLRVSPENAAGQAATAEAARSAA